MKIRDFEWWNLGIIELTSFFLAIKVSEYYLLKPGLIEIILIWHSNQFKYSGWNLSMSLIPFSQLTDEIKQYDRDTILNIPILLEIYKSANF